MPRKTIEEVLQANSHRLLSLPGVVGTAEGLCDSNPCLRVYVTRRSAELVRQIFDMVDGFPVVIEEKGDIYILPQGKEEP